MYIHILSLSMTCMEVFEYNMYVCLIDYRHTTYCTTYYILHTTVCRLQTYYIHTTYILHCSI